MNTGSVNRIPQDEKEATRSIPQAMTELASTVGDLRTAVQALAHRIAPTLPSGNPYDRPETPKGSGTQTAPRPVRSHHAEELHSRIYEMREVIGALSEMANNTEF